MPEVTLGGRDSVQAARYDPRASLLTVEAGTDEDTLVGSASDDVLQGGGGADTIKGGGSGDTIQGDAGADLLEGGARDDSFIWKPGTATTRYWGNPGGTRCPSRRRHRRAFRRPAQRTPGPADAERRPHHDGPLPGRGRGHRNAWRIRSGARRRSHRHRCHRRADGSVDVRRWRSAGCSGRRGDR